MADNYPSKKSSQHDIQAFLKQVSKTPVSIKGKSHGRLIFAMDATASREQLWDMASEIHSEMFEAVSKIGGLSIQLCYYRGYKEFQCFSWTDQPVNMLTSITSVRCLAGKTQIEKVLNHALHQTQQESIQALVFVGDAMEENVDKLGELAGQLGIYKVPAFFFQEGKNPVVTRAFKHFAHLSGGAHCAFDAGSAHVLLELLRAVAIYAVGGLKALKNNPSQSQAVKILTQQLGYKK